MKTAFIGHRQVLANNIDEKLEEAVKQEIDNGCVTFAMGTHGAFDRLALRICRKLRRTYENLKIEVVITSFKQIEKESKWDRPNYDDVETVMYDIEKAYYKQKITLSNRQMLDTCDTLICYVDTTAYRSGAKKALHYAEKQGLKIVNLYREEDQPMYGLSQEEKNKRFEELYEKVVKRKNDK